MHRSSIRYYLHIFWLFLSEFWSTTDKALAATAVVLFLGGLSNRKWTDEIVATWSGVSAWWSTVPIGLFTLYRLLRINHKAFENMENRAVMAEKKLKARQDTEKAQGVFVQELNEGARLRRKAVTTTPELREWKEEVEAWIEATAILLEVSICPHRPPSLRTPMQEGKMRNLFLCGQAPSTIWNYGFHI
jgi:hypothetical protein